MVIYGRPNISLGKDIPAMGPFKNYKPSIVGPHSSKIKVGIYIGLKVGRYVLSRPWAKGTLSGTAIGTGLNLDGTLSPDVSPVSDDQAYDQYRKRSGSLRNGGKYRTNTSRRSKRCIPDNRCC